MAVRVCGSVAFFNSRAATPGTPSPIRSGRASPATGRSGANSDEEGSYRTTPRRCAAASSMTLASEVCSKPWGQSATGARPMSCPAMTTPPATLPISPHCSASQMLLNAVRSVASPSCFQSAGSSSCTRSSSSEAEATFDVGAEFGPVSLMEIYPPGWLEDSPVAVECRASSTDCAFRLATFDTKLAVAGLIALQNATQSEPQPLCSVRAQNNAIFELALEAAIARDVPGLFRADKTTSRLPRHLHLHSLLT